MVRKHVRGNKCRVCLSEKYGGWESSMCWH